MTTGRLEMWDIRARPGTCADGIAIGAIDEPSVDAGMSHAPEANDMSKPGRRGAQGEQGSWRSI
ncbi:hypothetical protein BXY70_2457 [Roseovarius halotolerans]|uniref:Uncharacterized protein n=1 Tax=Roseovarius halotolerans TaxID=505353 RepID=A0A1X6Z964_9RHOB|nr:hypothetical protein [Roseovarius halotolerans]RKT30468.1 hypothetical protein BXY70_2457 [Roseovarius halotolerans]SLN44690.1 hypothetical protein ROH8110_02354 [Roseovarius halotolerans]